LSSGASGGAAAAAPLSGSRGRRGGGRGRLGRFPPALVENLDYGDTTAFTYIALNVDRKPIGRPLDAGQARPPRNQAAGADQ
jgi:hypothetical protein